MRSWFTSSGIGISALVAALMAGVLWGASRSEARVETAVRQNFSAAELLARLQVKGEQMRRFEKEMFIYLAVPDKRDGYVKEFDEAYNKMLPILDTMLMPSGKSFSDEERATILQWKQAAVFYVGEFTALAHRARAIDLGAMSAEQRARLSVEFNEGIKAGKDKFRALLGGTEKMREAKEERAQSIATEIDDIFGTLRAGLLAGGLLVIGLILYALRRNAVPQARPAAVSSRLRTE